MNELAIPLYLQAKLESIGISSCEQLSSYDSLEIFQKLKALHPQINYKFLFDLHCLGHNLPFNSLNAAQKEQLKAAYNKLPPRHFPLDAATIDHYLKITVEIADDIPNEVPISALIVKNNKIIAWGKNQTITANDITRHAEIVAITQAARVIGTHRLDGCDLYVTIEPCLMCAGAILHSRIQRVIFGAIEPKTGAVVSQYQVFNNSAVNKHTEVIGPVDNALYSMKLQKFFAQKRHNVLHHQC
ncbi:MAG: tRNA-specific adenosine deaminase [Burkholderiales bacterium]|nr:tRNA-specific adenosine deaminase [Burkholderiales bacterium]